MDQLGLSLPITSGIRLHPATAQLVHNFARALAEKLSRAEQKYGYSDNWAKNNWLEECQHKLVEHVGKGDPLDVAAYAAFLWSHGARTSIDVLLDYLETLVTREELARAVEENGRFREALTEIARSVQLGAGMTYVVHGHSACKIARKALGGVE